VEAGALNAREREGAAFVRGAPYRHVRRTRNRTPNVRQLHVGEFFRRFETHLREARRPGFPAPWRQPHRPACLWDRAVSGMGNPGLERCDRPIGREPLRVFDNLTAVPIHEGQVVQKERVARDH
jgi:hypothetical protein